MIKAFGYALNGWQRGLKERNFKIDLTIAVCVVSAAIFFQISTVEWLIIFFLIGAVLSAELFNTAIEEICNVISRKLKLGYSDTTYPRDLAAGAVLVIATVAALIGLIIFIPKVLMLFW
jgi:diacylglycerol kinase